MPSPVHLRDLGGQLSGLWLNVPALLAGDAASMLNTLRAGLASPDHAEFVNRLQACRIPRGSAQTPVRRDKAVEY